MEKVDAIIIGSGQGGVPLAAELAGEGRQVVLFERERLGGSCINWGCTPSKALLASAHAAGRARAASSLGVRCQVEVDFPSVMERVRQIRDRFNQGIEKRLSLAGVRVVAEQASFAADGSVRAGGQVFAAPLVVIDTGSSPAVPPLPGLEGIPYLTDRTFWNLRACPPRTLVIGGGYIGLELGQALARLGSEVHILQRSERVLSLEDEAVSEVLHRALQQDGISLHLNAQARKVEYHEGLYKLFTDKDGVLEGEALLVAVGRRPNTEALSAQGAGIELDDNGYVQVNSRLETSRQGVYAIGEAAGQPAFTNVSWEDYRRLHENLSGGNRTRDDRVLSYAVFSEPQVGRTGLSLSQARQRGIAVRDARMELSHMARGIEWDLQLGFFEILVDEKSDRFVGGTLVGYEAGELVHIVADLINANATVDVLATAQHIHPTFAENLVSLGMQAIKQ